jgi:DNA primase catalytic subunit
LFAKQHTLRLLEYLDEQGFGEVLTVFSGRQGFHVYLFDLDEKTFHERRNDIIRELRLRKIKIDEKVTFDRKGVVTFPGSLHGSSLLPALPIANLHHFGLRELKKHLVSSQDVLQEAF